MHDLSAIQNLCRRAEEIAQKHHAKRVSRMLLEVGERSHWTQEHLRETFLIVRTGHSLFRETELTFRKSSEIEDEAILLRDVEMEVSDSE